MLEGKDTQRSLWWLPEDKPGSSIKKIKNWIQTADLRYKRNNESPDTKAAETSLPDS